MVVEAHRAAQDRHLGFKEDHAEDVRAYPIQGAEEEYVRQRLMYYTRTQFTIRIINQNFFKWPK